MTMTDTKDSMDAADYSTFASNGSNSIGLDSSKSHKSQNVGFKLKATVRNFFQSREYSAPPTVNLVKKYCPTLWTHKKLKWFTVIYLALVYLAYHMSRLPFSIAKTVLHTNCSTRDLSETHGCGWAPFEGRNYTFLFGMLDFAFTFSYSMSLMLISGPLAERMRPRAFLMIGILLSGLATCAFGLGYDLQIHSIWYYVICQIALGIFQSTGWPTIIAILSEWTDKKTRGRTIGLWSVAMFVGNIFGALVPGHFVSANWAMSFHVPGICMIVLGVITPFITIGGPQEVGFDRDGNPLKSTEESISVEPSPLKLQTKRSSESSPLVVESSNELSDERVAVTWLQAIKISGVLEFAVCLFFIKLVSYTALFWLPKMMNNEGYSPETSSYLTAVFDLGGMIGALAAGLIGDSLGMAGVMVAVSLAAAMPPLLVLNFITGQYAIIMLVVALLIAGVFVNGPYAYIAGVISSKKGDDDEVGESKKGVSTVSGIIDGIGSFGGAVGPFIAGYVAGFSYSYIIYIFLVALFLGILVLTRQVFLEVKGYFKRSSR